MNRDVALAVDFAKAPKELQDAAKALNAAEKILAQQNNTIQVLTADLPKLIEAVNQATRVYKKLLNDWNIDKAQTTRG